MRARASVPIVVLVLLIGGCEMPEPPLIPFARAQPVQRGVVGCWTLRFEDWHRDLALEDLRIRLDSIPLYSDTQSSWLFLAVETQDSISAERFRRSGWAPVAQRPAIYGFIGDGHSGIHFDLAIQGETLQGRGSTYVDFVPSISRRGQIRGSRVPCVSRGPLQPT